MTEWRDFDTTTEAAFPGGSTRTLGAMISSPAVLKRARRAFFWRTARRACFVCARSVADPEEPGPTRAARAASLTASGLIEAEAAALWTVCRRAGTFFFERRGAAPAGAGRRRATMRRTRMGNITPFPGGFFKKDAWKPAPRRRRAASGPRRRS